jgi:osmotically-inducible protein OsmY
MNVFSIAAVALFLTAAAATAGQEATAPDNSERNERDADGTTLTPMDQSSSETDLKVTQNIRREVVDDDSLSTMAQNVKIITINGVVTLRGPVESETERQQIAALAERIAGRGKVQNQLEIAR